MALTVTNHGFHTSSGGTTTTVSITASAGDVITVATIVGQTGSSTPSLSISGLGLTWTTRKQYSYTPTTGSANGHPFTITVFQALTASSQTAQTATVTSTVTIDDAATCYMSVSGTNATYNDPNVLIPATANAGGVSSNPTVSVTTTLSNNLVFMVAGRTGGFASPSTQTIGGVTATVTDIANNGGGTFAACIVMAYLVVSSPQSSASCVFSGTSFPASDWAMIGDALTADTASTPGRSNYFFAA